MLVIFLNVMKCHCSAFFNNVLLFGYNNTEDR